MLQKSFVKEGDAERGGLNTIFYHHLLESGLDESYIIRFAFDSTNDLSLRGCIIAFRLVF